MKPITVTLWMAYRYSSKTTNLCISDITIFFNFRYDDVDYGGGEVGRLGDGGGGGLNRSLRAPPRPVTPQTLMSNDLSSHHETAF